MHILHLINSLDCGGAETFVVRLSTAQVRSGNRVCVALLGGGDRHLIAEAEKGGVEVARGSTSSLYSPGRMREVLSRIGKDRFDVVHTHLFPSQYVGALAATWVRDGKRPRFITTEHSTHNRRRMCALLRATDSWAYCAYDVVACVSEAARLSLIGAQPSIAKKCVVVENGLDFDDIDAAQRGNLGLLTGLPRPIVLCVGRLKHEKGQDVLIRALKHAPGSLALVGVGESAGELQSLADALGLGNRVRFLGLRTDVWSLMKDCDVYVQPSRWEGFGIAALEAIAVGARTVCSDIPGLREVVRGLAFLVPPGDEAALAQGIRLALAETSERRDASLRERYSITAAVKRYAALYG